MLLIDVINKQDLLTGVITGVVVGLFLFIINLFNNKQMLKRENEIKDFEKLRKFKLSNNNRISMLIEDDKKNMKNNLIEFVLSLHDSFDDFSSQSTAKKKLSLWKPIYIFNGLYMYPDIDELFIIDTSHILSADNATLNCLNLYIGELEALKKELRSKKYKKNLQYVIEQLNILVSRGTRSNFIAILEKYHVECIKKYKTKRDTKNFFTIPKILETETTDKLNRAVEKHINHPLFSLIEKSKTQTNVQNNIWIFNENLKREDVRINLMRDELEDCFTFTQYGPVVILSVKDLEILNINSWCDISVIYTNLQKLR